MATEKADLLSARRSDRFREKFVMNNTWMRGMSQSQVEGWNKRFEGWISEGVLPGSGFVATATGAGAGAGVGAVAGAVGGGGGSGGGGTMDVDDE